MGPRPLRGLLLVLMKILIIIVLSGTLPTRKLSKSHGVRLILKRVLLLWTKTIPVGAGHGPKGVTVPVWHGSIADNR